MFNKKKLLSFSVAVIIGFTSILAGSGISEVDAAVEVPKFKASDYYKQDTDGDGIIDIYDKNPDKWDVSDRDLRYFMELSYRDENYIRDIFNGYTDTIEKFNREKLNSSADVREIIGGWNIVKQINIGSFSATLFTDKTGKQVVVAFRGTDDAGDVGADTSIFFGSAAGQVDNLPTVFNEIRNYSEIYLTGHSLGGYLAQYFASRELFNDKRFKHSAIFNAPGIKGVFGWEHKTVAKNAEEYFNRKYIFDADKRNVKELYVTQPYGIHGDGIAGLYAYPMTFWNNKVNDGSAHSITNFVGTKQDNNFRNWFSVGYRLDKPYDNVDTDKDGILDKDELRIGTDYTKADTDGDGYSDKIELLYGMDANNNKKKLYLNQFYTTSRTGAVRVDKRSDLTTEEIKRKAYTFVKSEFTSYADADYIPYMSNDQVRYEVVNYPDNLEVMGVDFNVKVKAIYVDGSSNFVDIPVHIEENKKIDSIPIVKVPNISDYYEIVKLTIYKGESVDLKNGLRLKDGVQLPDGISLQIEENVDTNTIGEKIGKVRVVFPNGSSRVASINVEVKDKINSSIITSIPNISDYYEIEKLIVYKDDDIDITTGLKVKDGVTLPNGISLQIEENVDTNTIGEKIGKVRVVFPNGSSRVASINVEVKDKINSSIITSIPNISDYYEIEKLTVYKGENVDLMTGLRLKDGVTLPDGISLQIEENVDTSTIGEKIGKVRVVFPNGSSRVASINVEVKDKVEISIIAPIPSISTYFTIRDLIVYKGDIVDLTTAFDKVTSINKFNNVNLEVIENVDTSEVGEKSGKVKVIFENGSSRTVNVKVIVKDKIQSNDIVSIPEISEYYEIIDMVVYKGDTINIKEALILRKDVELPVGIQLHIEKDVDTDTVGEKIGKVRVVFPDGSSRVASIKVKVKDKINSSIITSIPNVSDYYEIVKLTVYKGDNIDITTGLKVKDGVTLPDGTSLQIEENVDTSTIGEKTGKVRVVFPNNSSRVVDICVNVKDKMPMSMIIPIPDVNSYFIIKDLRVYQGESVDLTKAFERIRRFRSFFDVKLEVVENVDTSTIGEKIGKVKVIFMSGASKLVEIKVNVEPKIPMTNIIKIPEVTDYYDIKNIVVYKGDTVDLLSAFIVKNDKIKELPKLYIIEAVNTETIGNKIGKVKVVFESGASKIVDVNVLVKENMEIISNDKSEASTKLPNTGYSYDILIYVACISFMIGTINMLRKKVIK